MKRKVVTKVKRPGRPMARKQKAAPKLQVPDSCRVLGRFVPGFVP